MNTKIAHSSSVAVVTLILVPKSRSAKATPSSERISRRPIFLPHLRHLPFRNIQERMGILSYHLSCALQERQTERGPSDFFVFLEVLDGLAVDASSRRRRRRAWQHRNEPKQAPITNKKTKKIICISLFYHSGVVFYGKYFIIKRKEINDGKI